MIKDICASCGKKIDRSPYRKKKTKLEYYEMYGNFCAICVRRISNNAMGNKMSHEQVKLENEKIDEWKHY